MSYTNGTTHYNLPLTTGADKRDWSDTNQAFSDVDAALYGAVQDTAQAELDIDALETRMDTAEQNISTNTGNIAGLDTRVTTVEGAITSLSGQVTDTRQDLEDMICAFNEASATSTHAYAIGDYFIYNDVLYRAIQAIAIGDTIVPDTNCSTTNVTTELLASENLSEDVQQLKSDMTAAQGDIEDLETAISPLKTKYAGGNIISTVDFTTSDTYKSVFTSLLASKLESNHVYAIILHTGDNIFQYDNMKKFTSSGNTFWSFTYVTLESTVYVIYSIEYELSGNTASFYSGGTSGSATDNGNAHPGAAGSAYLYDLGTIV